MAKSRARSAITTAAFSIAIFVAFILAFEVVLRATHLFGARVSWSEPDSLLGFRFVPGAHYWFSKENDHPVSGKINNYGWRDRDWTPEKSPGALRIAILGDSFVEAFQVESESTFVALAERELNRGAGTRVELMNFGCSGFTQTEELIVLKNHVSKFSPDMAVVFFLPGNDIEDVRRETSSAVLRPFYNVSENGELSLDTSFTSLTEFRRMCLMNGVKRHSALISLVAERYNTFRLEAARKKLQAKRVESIAGGRVGGVMSLCTSRPDSSYFKSYGLNKILIRAMAQYCGGKGIRMVLVSADTGAYIPEAEEKYKSTDSTFNANFFEDDMEMLAGALDIEHLGLQRVFRQAYEGGRIPLHWAHWNYRGHRVVAGVLAEKLGSGLHSSLKVGVGN